MKHLDMLSELSNYVTKVGLLDANSYSYQKEHIAFVPQNGLISASYQNFLKAMSSKATLVKIAFEGLIDQSGKFQIVLEQLIPELSQNKYADALNFGMLHALNNIAEAKDTLCEMFLVSTISAFEAYIQDITFEIYTLHPETLRSGKTLTYEEAMHYSDMNDLIAHLARKQAAKATEGTPKEYLEILGRKFGIDIHQIDSLIEAIEECVTIRNLVVHSSGIIDSKALYRLKINGWEEGSRIQIDLLSAAGISATTRLTVNMLEAMLMHKFIKAATVEYDDEVEVWQSNILNLEELPARHEKAKLETTSENLTSSDTEETDVANLYEL